MDRSNNKIISGFDLLKFLMALVVINIHLQLKNYVNGTHLAIAWNFINELAVPVFFVLSSFFLFKNMREGVLSENKRRLLQYESRLIRLYLFWIIVLFPVILYYWHREYLESPIIGVLLFVKNFFLAYEFGASWFFGALIIGVPIIYMFGRVFNEEVALFISLIVYIYLYYDSDDKYLVQLYTEYVRTPRLSFPAGLLWISIGAIISDNEFIRFAEKTRLCFLITGGVTFILLGIIFNHYDYIFRIPSALYIIFVFWKLRIQNKNACKRMRIYSTHFFCLHFSIIVLLKRLPNIYFDNIIILGLETLIICFIISNVLLYLMRFKYFSWIKYSY